MGVVPLTDRPAQLLLHLRLEREAWRDRVMELSLGPATDHDCDQWRFLFISLRIS
jgi:hypothetical protein